jgi:integrase
LTEPLKRLINEGDKSGFVFKKKDGSPCGSVKTGFLRAIKKVGLEGLRFHDLRHTFGTRLVVRGVDIVTVKELLGHETIKMTMRYSHPTPEYKREAVQVLEPSHNIFHNIEEMEPRGTALSI